MSQKYHMTESHVPLSFEYKYRVGQSMEKFLDGLAQGKILGVRCETCNRVVVPPRSVCGFCNQDMKQWVEVANEGVLVNFTVAHVYIDNGQVIPLSEPYVIGQVRLDGADSLLTAKIEASESETLSMGMRVRAVFSEQRKGTVKDLDHFEPIG